MYVCVFAWPRLRGRPTCLAACLCITIGQREANARLWLVSCSERDDDRDVIVLNRKTAQ